MKIKIYSKAFWMWLLPQTNLFHVKDGYAYKAFIWLFWMFLSNKPADKIAIGFPDGYNSTITDMGKEGIMDEYVAVSNGLDVVIAERDRLLNQIHETEQMYLDLREENEALRAHISKRISPYIDFVTVLPPWVKEARDLLRAKGNES